MNYVKRTGGDSAFIHSAMEICSARSSAAVIFSEANPCGIAGQTEPQILAGITVKVATTGMGM